MRKCFKPFVTRRAGDGRLQKPLVSAAAAFHGALYLAFAFAVLDGVAFVMFGLAFCQSDFAFNEAVFPVQVQRHQGKAFLFHLANQVLDVGFLEQELFGAGRLGADMGGCGLKRIDLAAEQEQFTLANQYVAICELHLAFAQCLDFPAVQHHARFVAFLEEIVVGRFLVVGNAGRRIGFFGHGELDAAQTGS